MLIWINENQNNKFQAEVTLKTSPAERETSTQDQNDLHTNAIFGKDSIRRNLTAFS
jgi:hypothetical protein